MRKGNKNKTAKQRKGGQTIEENWGGGGGGDENARPCLISENYIFYTSCTIYEQCVLFSFYSGIIDHAGCVEKLLATEFCCWWCSGVK